MSRPFRVGLYVVLSLLLMGFGVFLIGDNRRAWERKVDYRAAWTDVSGLKSGAPVRSGGFDIGHVISVDYSDDPSDPRIYVTMSVARRESLRIREGTTARISPKGLLGDKMIELVHKGTGGQAHDPKKLLPSEEPQDMMARANELADSTRKVVEKLDPLAVTLSDPSLGADIRGTVSSVRTIVDAVATKDSVAHRLLFDAQQAQKVDQALDNLVRATAQLDATLANANAITSRVRTGPGTVHRVLYDDKLANELSGTVGEANQMLRAVRTGGGLAHTVVYGDGQSQRALENLGAAAEDVRHILAAVRSGKGTIGALLTDPSIYEDIKAAIGNVERNQVFRALVRYSIKADDARPKVEPPKTAPTHAPAPSSKGP